MLGRVLISTGGCWEAAETASGKKVFWNQLNWKWLRHGWQESEEPMRVAGGDINNRGGFEDTEFVVGGGDGG